jgi:MFS transporter, DHA1 family, multidrug resistance protein
MAQDFGVSTQVVANSLPAYFLGLAVGQLIYGPVSDRIGRKIPLYFGMSLYVLASLLCFFAQDEWSLMLARVLQALGGCVGVVIARAAIRDRLTPEASAQAFASMMMVMTIAPIIAPSLGAIILKFFSWHALFMSLALIGMLCLICIHFFFDETLAPERRLKLNFNQVLALYASIFKDARFRTPMLIGCFSGGMLFVYISSSSAVFMDMFKLSQQQFGLLFGMNAVGIVLFSSLNKVLAKRLNIFQRLRLGNSIQVGGVCILVSNLFFMQPVFWWVVIGLFFAKAGIGLTGPNTMALAMSHQGARAGTASAIMGSMQFFCGLLGGILLNFLLWDALTNMILAMLMFISVSFSLIYMMYRQQQH